MSKRQSQKAKVQINDLPEQSVAQELTPEQAKQVKGGLFKKQGKFPGYTAPTVISDDGINIQTSDPLTSNVADVSGGHRDRAPCGIGCDDADLFARAAGTDYDDETSVGEFLLGSKCSTTRTAHT